MMKIETTKRNDCSDCPVRSDCDKLTEYTLCELLNVPDNEVITKIIKEDD